jgi:hypothetical protein
LRLYNPAELASRLGVVKGKRVRLIVFVGGETHEIEWPILPAQKVRSRHKPADWTLSAPRPSADAQPNDGQPSRAKNGAEPDANLSAEKK